MTDYKDAGVDIEAGEAAVQRIAALAKETTNANVLASVGGFAAAYRLPDISEPTLISTTDGVGTKLLLALQCDAHETVGIDLVAMVANDLLASGAQPLFSLIIWRWIIWMLTALRPLFAELLMGVSRLKWH